MGESMLGSSAATDPPSQLRTRCPWHSTRRPVPTARGDTKVARRPSWMGEHQPPLGDQCQARQRSSPRRSRRTICERAVRAPADDRNQRRKRAQAGPGSDVSRSSKAVVSGAVRGAPPFGRESAPAGATECRQTSPDGSYAYKGLCRLTEMAAAKIRAWGERGRAAWAMTGRGRRRRLAQEACNRPEEHAMLTPKVTAISTGTAHPSSPRGSAAGSWTLTA
jgi:hypothetical protein